MTRSSAASTPSPPSGPKATPSPCSSEPALATPPGERPTPKPLYRASLARGLSGSERVQAHIQLASTIRNLGRPNESIALLDAIEPDAGELRDAVVAFRALALSTRATPAARHPMPWPPSRRICRGTARRWPHTPRS